jgi:MFS family permease
VLALTALPKGPRAIARDRRFRLFLIASALASFAYFQAQTTFALQTVADGHSSVVYGTLLAINGLAIVLVELPLISLTQRLPRMPVLATGLLLEGIGFGLIPLSGATAWLALTVVVWSFGEMILSPVAGAYVADLSPAHLRGRYSGAWAFTWGIGLVLAPSLGALLFSIAHALVWLVCLGCGLAAAAFVVASAPQRHRDRTTRRRRSLS